ncbi:MAG: acyltransferase [bacterium]|nr:acyltransferase [bacterium]
MKILKKLRDQIFTKCHHFPANPYNPHCWIIGDPKIGPKCWIGAFTVIDGSGGLSIGEGTTVSCGVHIYTHSAVRRNISANKYPQIDRKPVQIGQFCHIGPNSTILMGVKIGNRVVVGAGSVILEDTEIPDDATVVGNPGRVINLRSNKLWEK